MLSELAIADPATFDAIVEAARPHLVVLTKKSA
jgi:ribosomal protein L20